MKTLFDFIYCDGMPSPATVFYLVSVGISRRDKAAFSFVRRAANTNNFFFTRHDNLTQSFINRCANSIFSGADEHKAAAYLRRKLVPVTWLASFLRQNPPALLNSLRIDTLKTPSK